MAGIAATQVEGGDNGLGMEGGGGEKGMDSGPVLEAEFMGLSEG